jgi:hypothetical protein
MDREQTMTWEADGETGNVVSPTLQRPGRWQGKWKRQHVLAKLVMISPS